MTRDEVLQKHERRCTGHCCERFTLPFTSIEEMREQHAQRIESGGVGFQDGDFILDMLIKLPEQDTDVDGAPLKPDDATRHRFYTCRHHDKATGNCTVYEQRPRMCSGYPYKKECRYQGCQRTSDANTVACDQRELVGIVSLAT